MEERQGYDVLKIVKHSDRCYMSTDYVKGKVLVVWLKYHPQIGKEQLYRWMRGLLENLEHFHRCRGNPCYQYVNPYSIIVGEDEKLYLLDLGSRQQEDMLHVMQRRYVRENFLSPENQYYQKASVREDIYGLGKTIQYLLSAVEVEPSLGRVEEIRLKKFISRCLDQDSKKSYQTIQELSKYFPNTKKQRKIHKALSKKILFAAAVVVIIASGIRFAGERALAQKNEKGEQLSGELSDTENNNYKSDADYREEIREKQKQWDTEKQEIEQEFKIRERELLYELALLYFVELEDYQKSKEAVEEMEEPDEFAGDFAKLCGYLDGQMPFAQSEDMKELLSRMEKEVPDSEDERYAYCIARGYESLEESGEEITDENDDGNEEK